MSTGVAAFPLIEENPYQHLLYSALASFGLEVIPDAHFKIRELWRARGRIDVLHFHWPQNYYRWWRRPARHATFLSWVKLGLFAVRLMFGRALGYRIAWTIHEVYPHERAPGRVDRLGSALLARFSHVLIAHDRGTARHAAEQLGCRLERITIVPHGSYIGVYPEGRSRAAVRSELGLAAGTFVFLSFGHLRAYKEIERLLAAFSGAALPDAALVVAGLPLDGRSSAAVRDAAEADPRIIPLLEFVPDERVAELFGAADAAVLPRSDGGTSGALILALSLGLPVVAARVDDYAELTGGEGAGWLFEPGEPDSLRDTLERAATDREAAQEKGRGALAQAEVLRWPEIAARTASLLAPTVDTGAGAARTGWSP